MGANPTVGDRSWWLGGRVVDCVARRSGGLKERWVALISVSVETGDPPELS